VLDVEHREADDHPGVAAAVGERKAKIGDAGANALHGWPRVKAVDGYSGLELG